MIGTLKERAGCCVRIIGACRVGDRRLGEACKLIPEGSMGEAREKMEDRS